MELVTGFQGKNHVTARQVSRLIAGLATDGETYVLKTLDQLPAELLNVNTVSIGTGDIIADGTYFTVEAPEEITIENGVTGLNRNDLIVARYLKAEPAVDEDGIPDYTIPRVESGELAVVKGAPSSGDPDDPAVVEASVYDDNTTLAEFPLYRIPIRGLSVGTPEPLFKILPPGAERWDSLSQDITDLPKRIAHEDVKITADLSVTHANGQPLRVTVAPKNVTTENYIAKKLVYFWPNSTWSQNNEWAMVVMQDIYSTGEAIFSPWFTTNIKQTYQLMVRYWYWA